MFRTSIVAAIALAVAQPVFAQAGGPSSNPHSGGKPDMPIPDGTQTVGTMGRNLSWAANEPTYFHRAGATLEEHDSAVRACLSLAAAMDEPLGHYYENRSVDLGTVPGGYSAGGVLGLLVVAGIQTAIADGEAEQNEPNARAANVENCMVSYGWDMRSVSAEEEVRLNDLPLEQLRLELAGRIGAAEPTDPLYRTFGNELTNARSVVFGRAGGNARSLSLRLIPDEVDDYVARMTLRDARRFSDDNVRMRRGMGLVAVRLRGSDSALATRLRFIRMDGTGPAGDREPNSFIVELRRSRTFVTHYDQVSYFETPPGVWRLAEILDGPTTLSLCLAAPEFSVEVGQGVFAGTIDLTQSFLPDVTLEDGLVTEARGIAFTPATYSQAGQVRCVGAYLYSLQLEHEPATSPESAGTPELVEAAPAPVQSDIVEEAGSAESSAPVTPVA